MNRRVQRLRDKLHEQELESIFVSSADNRRYLSGFVGSAGYLLISAEDAVLATDFRYVEQAGGQAPDFRVQRIAGELDWFPTLAAEMGVKRVAFESQEMTVSVHRALEKAIERGRGSDRLELVPTSDLVDRLRAVKDAEEIGLLSRAVEIADQAIDAVAPTMEAGVTEAEVAWELEKAMREAGAESLAFDIIVGAGPNGALPHHRAGDQAIRMGDSVVIDMGARFEGYCSDLTRSFIIGPPNDKFRRVYDTVLRAQLAAEEGVEAGMTGAQVDAIARDIIGEAGYADNFGHSLGHGVGLAVHEYPRVGPKAEDVLEDGMVFTVEPGVYLSGWGGVRIEDIVVMEGGRARVVSKARKLEG